MFYGHVRKQGGFWIGIDEIKRGRLITHAEVPEGDDVGVGGFDVVFDDVGGGEVGDLLLAFAFAADFECAVADLQ